MTALKSEIRLKLDYTTSEAATFTLLDTAGARIIRLTPGALLTIRTEARAPHLTLIEGEAGA